MNKLIGLLLAALLVTALPLGDALGRGFGGFRGGGFGGGGFDRGGLGGEGRDRSFDTGEFGGFSQRGFDASRWGDMDRSRGKAYHSEATRSSSEDGWRSSHLSGADWSRSTASVSRTKLDSFIGMPTDAGVGHMASASTDRGFEGTRMSAGRVEGPHGGSASYVSGTRVHGGATAVGGGIEGGRVTAGRVEGPRGGSAAFVSRTRLHYIPQGVAAGQGRLVRNDFNSHSLFTPAWYTSHATAWGAATLGASAWAPATWNSASDWVGCDSEPEDYDYGSTVLYQGDNVYVEGQRVGSDTEYYDQASSLAASGGTKQDDQTGWLPLGVFGMVQGQQTDPTMIFQLAVNHKGIIRGNFYSTITDTTLPVHGAVDKKTQRAAWTMGDNKSTVVDTGLANLTKDEGPALLHFGKDRTEEWLLVRLKGKAGGQNDS